MKRILTKVSLLVAIVLTLSMSACGTTEPSTTDSTTTAQTTAADTTTAETTAVETTTTEPTTVATTKATSPKTKKQSSDSSIKDTPYEKLTAKQKSEIVQWIKDRYKYYDDLEGRDTGDEYTKDIYGEASEQFNKKVTQIISIWADSFKQ